MQQIGMGAPDTPGHSFQCDGLWPCFQQKFTCRFQSGGTAGFRAQPTWHGSVLDIYDLGAFYSHVTLMPFVLIFGWKSYPSIHALPNIMWKYHLFVQSCYAGGPSDWAMISQRKYPCTSWF